MLQVTKKEKQQKPFESLYCLLAMILKHTKEKQDLARTLKGEDYVRDARKCQRMR